MFSKTKIARILFKINAYDSFGGGGYSGGEGSVSGNYGGAGTGTGGDFSGGQGKGVGSDLSSISQEIQAGYEDAMGRAATAAEQGWLAKAIDIASFALPGGGVASLAAKAMSGKTIGQAIASAVARGGVSDPYSSAGKGSTFAGKSGSEQTAEGGGNDFVTMASDIITNTASGPSGSASLSKSSGIPGNISAGLDKYVTDSNKITSDYNTKADSIWNDYLDFENTYFGKYEDVQKGYQSNLDSIPKLNLTLPNTIGGATLPLAPKVSSAMYSDQANTKGNLIGQQANTALSGMSSRNALNNNLFNVNQTGLSNSLLPTQTDLDLYKMERASQLGLNNSLALADANKPSTLSTWAPVVGTLLSSNGTGKTNLSSAWDFISGLWD